ncbi:MULTISPECIES: hypothetical protein [Marivivens]|jgi:hypothetical protein|nr:MULTISPECIES: hypothetical protein [Marivivens]MDN3703888.1 hypothetical protein [Marivivens donghaensis]
MAKDIKAVLSRSPVTVLSDLIGAVSLVVILYAGLTLPAFL